MKNDHPQRVTKPFFTFGTLAILIAMGVGYAFGLTRLLLGLGTVTNLDNDNPWGIWISFDVACGVALAAGGFTTAALVEIFGRKKYHALLRPAILTAFLGYLWVAIALSFDLGRYWNIWRPIFNWQGNSVLFEVGMCVTFYLMVLSIEMSPPILEGLKTRMAGIEKGSTFLRRFEKPVQLAYEWVRIIMPLFIIAGVVLSFMHQSSLGTLMLIAPTKLSPFWNTAILPLLFLLSAIMVGFPMVVLESVYASISFGRKPEMELLEPLAKKIPWLIGIYGIVKIGDLIIRHNQLNFLQHPGATVSLYIEIIIGILAPFFLLQIKSVRRSMGWLFFSVFLIIFGVILNRINVFLVGYQPPFMTKGYFPSAGEFALTIAIVCSIMFCYRVFVTFFPILPGFEASREVGRERFIESQKKTVSPFWTWVFRGTAAVFLLSFVLLYTVVHKEAIAESLKAYRDVQIVKAKPRVPTQTPAFSHAFRPAAYKNFYILGSELLNSRSDYFEPVRFSHRTHDVNTGGDCGVCHHRVAMGDDDRAGEDLKSMHLGIEVRIGGACSSCHDLTEKKPNACAQCHGLPNEPDNPARIGLKGAYHRQCIGCHAEQPAGANAPTDCVSCHHPLTPDHSGLVTFTGAPTPAQVTAQCIHCHDTASRDVLKTAHWNWKGQTPDIAGHEHSISVGLDNTIDNYFINMGPNLAHFSQLHIGYGTLDSSYDYRDAAAIDCLVCHDTTGQYQKDGATGGMPVKGLDLAAIAAKVGRPGRAQCGGCHFYTGGGANVKHGDLEPALAKPGTGLDVHMGMMDMRCQDCHRTSRHQVAGMSFAAPVVEGRVACEDCHGPRPHGITGALSRHLDDHVRGVACETCHIPRFAREQATRLSTDFSQAGQDRPAVPDALGMPTYDKNFGTLTWGRNVTPVYRWFNGHRETRLVGDKIDPAATVSLNTPLGERQNPQARIYPFKIHTAQLPYDSESNSLVAPLLWDGLWKDFDWARAITAGMKRTGLPFSGKAGFVQTEMYTSLHHAVPPAKEALGCTDCHALPAVTCRRCHKDAGGMDQPAHTRMVYPEVKNRIDFKALGYKDDPALIGGRFYIYLGRGRPPQ